MANKDVLLQDNEVILLQDNGTPNNKSALSQNGQKRAPDLTESDIKAAFVEALTQKERPSARDVHAVLGRGSMNTIQPIVSKLNKQIHENQLTEIEKKRVTPEMVQALCEKLADTALNTIIKEDDLKIAKLKDKIEHDYELYAAEVEELTNQVAELTEKLNEANQSVAKKNDLINSLNQDNKDLSQTITDQEKEIVNLKAEVKSYATVQKILDGLDKKSKK